MLVSKTFKSLQTYKALIFHQNWVTTVPFPTHEGKRDICGIQVFLECLPMEKKTQITIVELVHLEIQYKTSYRKLLKETTMSVRKVLGIFTEQFTLLLSLT